MTKIEITQELVKEKFDYKDGHLYWKINIPTASIVIGDKAGAFNGKYFKVKIKNKGYSLHRIIFLWHKGYLPKFIDHEDLDKTNNRIENLREATKSQNMMNKNSHKGSFSKYKGVTKNYHSRGIKRWRARIDINKKQKSIGYFHTPQEAAMAYNREAVRLHGEFAVLNII